MMEITITLLVFLLIIGGSVWLQIFLSRRNNKWLGLTLPIICFVFSIVIIFSMVIFTSDTLTITTETIDGVVISEEISPLESEKLKIKEQLDKMNIQDLE